MNHHSTFKKLFLSGVFLLLLLNSCIKDSIQQLGNINGIEIDPDVSMPILNAHMGVKDIYNSYSNKANIIEGSDKSITFIFDSAYNLSQKQLLTIPPISFNYSVAMDQNAITLFNAVGFFSNTFSNTVVIAANNKERIKKVSVKTGSFLINISYNFKHNGSVVLNYPSITKNGNPLVDTLNLIYSGTSPILINKSIDITGYDVDLTNNGTSYNTIPYSNTITVTRNPLNGVTVNDQLSINEQITIQEYNFIQGYLGKFNILHYSTDNNLDIFDRQADGNVFFKDPKVRVKIQNGIGIPITAKISNFNIQTGKGDLYPVIVNQFKDTFTFSYPSINQQGQIIQSEYSIDRTNSNIDSVFNHSPQRTQLDVDFIANYDEDVSQDNFILGNNNIFISDISTELPLELKIYNYQIRKLDTLIWPTIPDNITIDWIKIKSWFQNSLPIGSAIQLYFAKDTTILGVDSFVVVDSLYNHPVFVSGAIVDMDGKIIQPSVITNEAVMDNSKYNKLKNLANKSFLVTNTRTSDYNGAFPFVKIYSNQGMDFKIGVEAKGKFKQKFN